MAAVAASAPASAAADPQWNAALLTGVCGTGADGAYWQDTCWYNGLRSDVLFGRARNADFGIGPHAMLTTADFADVRAGAGATLHVPAHAYVPLVVSASAFARHAHARWEPGIAGEIFVGSRSYNFHGSYVMATGLVVGLHQGLGPSRDSAIVIALQLDGLLTAMPFLLGYQWIRGPSSE